MQPRLRTEPFYPNVLRRREVPGLSLTESVYPAGLRMPRHAHEPAYFSLVLEGGYTEVIGRRELSGTPPTLIAHPPAETHSVAFHDREVRIFRVEMKAAMLERLREHRGLLEAPAGFDGGTPVWLALRLYGEFRAADCFSSLAIEGIVLEIAAESSRLGACDAGRRPPRWLERARELLHSRASDAPTLSEVAAEAGVHPVHLAHEFRKFYGASVGEYARRLRVEAACRQMARTEASLGEVAAAAGFYDQSHFNRTFKRHTGMTPAEFRASLRSH